jgi:competence protein ComEC
MANTIPPAALRVIKVAHHGSRTSSAEAFVNAIHPQVAIVSVGRANRFGHPAAEVLGRYRVVGAELFRTDQDGAVMVESDGESLSVSTFTGRHLDIHETHENTKHTK